MTKTQEMPESAIALNEFKKICKPIDENNLDREWLTMFGFFWKGWQAKAAQSNELPELCKKHNIEYCKD